MANESRCQREDCGFESRLLHQFMASWTKGKLEEPTCLEHAVLVSSNLTVATISWPCDICKSWYSYYVQTVGFCGFESHRGYQFNGG